MNKKTVWLIVILVVILIGIICLAIYLNKDTTRDGFAVDTKCQNSLSDILKKTMGLMDNNDLPADLKCMETWDFKNTSTNRGLQSGSSLKTTLFNLFQSKDSTGMPYIAKFYNFYKDDGKTEWDMNTRLSEPGDKTFPNVDKFLTNVIVPIIVDLKNKLTEISTSAALSGKYNLPSNGVNRQFINGFLSKYKDISDATSSSLYKIDGKEENQMYKAWTVSPFGLDPIAVSYVLKDSLPRFAINYLLNVDMTATAQCNIDIISTQVDNDVKKFIRLQTLFKKWRAKKSGKVNWTVADLDGTDFTSADPDYTKQGIIDYFTKELANVSLKPAGMTDAAFAVQQMNDILNKEFITDGGINDGRLTSDPNCLTNGTTDTVLHCNLLLSKRNICDVNMEACASSDNFNQFCTAVKSILDATKDPDATMPTINLAAMPTSAVADYLGRTNTTQAAGGTTTTAAAGGTSTTRASGGTATTATAGGTATTRASGGTATTAASTGLPGAGPSTLGSTLGSSSTSTDPLFTGKLSQYGIPSYFDRGTQDLLIFVYEKLSAAYNFDDEDVPDDIKQAISQLSPAGRANLCARYCSLTTRCNGICKLAGCMNCQVGTGSQAGSEAVGSSASSLGYAGVDDEYNLLGFLDEISSGGNTTVSSGSTSGGSGQDTYKHMGPMISQKDTNGVSNIFAPYIVMAPKKDGSTYGAYLLEDPNDPNYQAYINDLIKSF